MATTLKSATAELRHKPSRFIAVLLAIIIGVGFAAATAIFSATAGKAAERAAAQEIQNADVVVYGGDGPSSDADVAAQIANAPGIDAAQSTLASGYVVPGSSALSQVIVRSTIQDEKLAYAELASGTWPVAVDEITLDPETAKRADVGIGDQITLTSAITNTDSSFRVVGITDPDEALRSVSGEVNWASPEYLASQEGVWSAGILVRAADPDAAATTIKNVVPDGYTVMTGDDAREQAVDGITGGTTGISVILGTFGAIALAVAAIVIANTFTILLAQRRRTIALQRLIGATTKQLTRQIVIESGIVAVVGTALGVGLSILVGYVAADSLGFAGAGLSVPPFGLALAAIAGIATTMLAAYFPIRRAARIAPIEAMRPSETEAAGASIAKWRVITAGILFILGAIPFVLGVITTSLPAAALGGIICVVGILIGAQLIVVPFGKLLRPLGAIAGTPGKLAAREVVRHPARATNTVVALIVGVGLMSTLQVASSVVVATTEEQFSGTDQEFAIVRELLDIMTNVATALLAVAAVIAIVGIANTLALAVIERNRESALMRALGLKRGQLRTMVGIEAVFLALIGSVTGIVLGIGFGIAGAASTVGWSGLVIDLPWLRLGLFLVAGLLGGVLASVLPAIRATRVQPVTALAAS
ncbi:FtsX-like permease family protein [Epidermidibacterium keratini]|uniref:FtsX-like permease family protein n=1 Tax=Epidermidibacterium keratini TaxID=1891644 RepID=A0A7L4YMB9_9ACTN|nr:ABC transporter permease [Epidermidibacterium keratini]QHC00228.1 FtsX-like permease family protein [Epidermidibacterium keratini]